jgi:WD40 repeat protein
MPVIVDPKWGEAFAREGKAVLDCKDAIHMKLSPDGKTLATCGLDNTLHLWDLSSGRKRLSVVGVLALGPVTWSSDGTRLACLSSSESLTIRDARDGRILYSISTEARVGTAVWGPGDRTLATRTEKSVTLHDVSSGKQGESLLSLPGHATGVFLLDADGGKPKWKQVGRYDDEPLKLTGSHVAMLGDGDVLIPAAGLRAVTNSSGVVLFSNLRTGAADAPPIPSTEASEFVASPDGKFIATRNREKDINLWDTATLEHRARLQGKEFRSVSFSGDGKVLAAHGTDGIHLWRLDLNNPSIEWIRPAVSPLRTFKGSATFFLSVQFGPDNRTLFVQHNSDRLPRSPLVLTVWDTEKAESKVLLDAREGMVKQMAVSRDGKRVASQTAQGFGCWDVETGKRIGSVTMEQGKKSFGGLVFSGDGKTVYFGFGGQVMAWNTEKDAAEKVFDVEGNVIALRLSADGKNLVTASTQPSGSGGTRIGSLRIQAWDLDGAKKVSFPPLPPQMTFYLSLSGDGARDAMNDSDSTLKLWELSKGASRLLGTPTKNSGPVTGTFSPDGKRFYSGSHDGTLGVWDTAGELKGIELIKVHSGGIYGLAVSPDGKRLATVDGNGNCKLWDTARFVHPK